MADPDAGRCDACRHTWLPGVCPYCPAALAGPGRERDLRTLLYGEAPPEGEPDDRPEIPVLNPLEACVVEVYEARIARDERGVPLRSELDLFLDAVRVTDPAERALWRELVFACASSFRAEQAKMMDRMQRPDGEDRDSDGL